MSILKIPYLFNSATHIGLMVERTHGVGEKLIKFEMSADNAEVVRERVIRDRKDYDMSGHVMNGNHRFFRKIDPADMSTETF